MTEPERSGDRLPPLRDVIAALGLSAQKALGQNFILDLNLTRRIARLGAPLEGHTVIEIGPGPGGLTRALLVEGAARVVAVERDARCRPAIEAISAAYPGRVTLIEADALATDLGALAEGAPALIIANLPYNIATLLLTRWLETEPWPPWYERLVLMFQREVAERIVATPGTKAYGRLAVLSQWRSRPRIRMTLPPQAFVPPPKVESAVVELVPLPSPLPAGRPGTLARVTAAAFGQRRKMLRSSLGTLVAAPELLLAKAGVAPTLRAEQLDVAQFCRLAEALDSST